MVNDAETLGIDPTDGHPERALALSYAPRAARAGVAAVFALDATLARLALGTRDAMVAQLRLTWWYEALGDLAQGVVPAQPILRTLRDEGADAAALMKVAEGWELLLPAEIGDGDLEAFAAARASVFNEAARLAGARDDVSAAGRGWALADLALRSAEPARVAAATRLAMPSLQAAAAQRWSGAGRFLGALVHVARADLAGAAPPGAPRRVARLAWHRLTGR
ncbi:hypothetical protein F1C10_04965 [Sphingomonas sp. NBWT7]|uniref:squalene/phytoene synthase family protein n=1 Tax=Sphingomonas sp. NBWT7 TaxID=2596913 RepID=UPI00162666C7|nr:squalene/phytoene synthase family protein [Sphingomonas sp. NBWT7]QNE31351.1 hypothetical protein F1C10_04965 [Sphingomonas sp. NBWT7]